MSMIAEGALERGPSKRRLHFLISAVTCLAASQIVTILVDRAFGGHTTICSAAMLVGVTLVALGILIGVGLTSLLAPLRRALSISLRNERRCRTLAQDSVDLIGILSPSNFDPIDGSALTALLGYGYGETNGRAMTSFIHPADRRAATVCFLRLSAQNPRAVLTLRLQHKAGHVVWADACLRRVELEEGETETIVTVRDVTQRQREAQELRDAMATAQRAREEADHASQAKTDFLACMSHEIRSPLNSVIGFAGVLLQRTDLAPEARLHGERIRAAGKALLTVVDDILDFSRVEAGVFEVTPAPFSLPHLIDESLSIVHQEALAKQISLHMNLMERLPRVVLGDAARLRQVLLNLLYNAIKFTKQGSVLLDIRVGRGTGGDSVKFSIIDTGIGIAPGDLPRLFQRFAQVDGSIRRQYGGTGLGLAISKRLVELMGGEIGVESEKDLGSTFWFALPLPAQKNLPASTPASATALTTPRQVLLVEDIPMNQDLVRHILEARGHVVDVVCNGAEAIMAVRDLDYDLVLMDIQMPYLDGLTTTRMIRQLPHRCRDVPIVAMTANALPEQTRAAHEAGMIDVIHKPFSAEQIYAVLENITAGSFASAENKFVPDATPDGEILAKLAGLIGDAKVKQLLGSLADSLASRFDADPLTQEGREMLRRQAHASVAGSGMLGFSKLAASCKALEAAQEDATFPEALQALRRETVEVIAVARRLAGSTNPLAAQLAA